MYFNPNLFTTEGSEKIFINTGVNVYASRFSNFYCKWQPVRKLLRKLFWKFYINNGVLFLDAYSMFDHVN